MAFGTTYANIVLDNLLRNDSTPSATYASVFISLHTGDPGATGASEAAYTSYARIEVTVGFSAAASKTTDNDAAITFPENTGGSETETHVGIWDSLTTGVFLAGGALTASQLVPGGGIPEFAAGDLDVTLT